MRPTNHEQIKRKLILINQALDTTIRTMKNTLLLVDEIVKEVQQIKKIISKERDVLKFIKDLDRQGVNMTKQLLSVRLKHIMNFDELYINLLKAGEIFEIEHIVYPTTTKNDVVAEDDKKNKI